MGVTEFVLRHPALLTLGWTLVHFLWQGALLGIVAAVLLRAARHSAASTRYAIATIAMAAMVVVSAGTWVYLTKVQPSTASTLSASADTMEGQTLWRAASSDAATRAGLKTRPSIATGVETPAGTESTRTPLALAAFLFFYAAGVLVLSLRLVGGWYVARRLTRRLVSPATSELAALVVRVADQLDLRRVVRVLESSLVTAPAVVGWIAPVVLLPVTSLAGLAPAQLEALVAHELAHIKRHDYLVNLMQSAVETLLFFHPAVWWVSRRIRIEREHCCDDVAVALCGDRVVYASALADLERMRGASFALAATDGSLVARVRRILSPSTERPASASSWVGAVLILLIVSVVPAVMSSVRADKPTDQVKTTPAKPAAPSETVKVEQPAGPARIRSTDVLRIVVSGEPTMSRNYAVQSDGVIVFPMMRPLAVVGLTTDAVVVALAKALQPAMLSKPGADAIAAAALVDESLHMADQASVKLASAQARAAKLMSYRVGDPATDVESTGVLAEPEVRADADVAATLQGLRDLRLRQQALQQSLGYNNPEMVRLRELVTAQLIQLRVSVQRVVDATQKQLDLVRDEAGAQRARYENNLAIAAQTAEMSRGAAPKVTVTILKPGTAKTSESSPEPERAMKPAEPERIVSLEPHEVPVEQIVPVEAPAQEKPAETLVSKPADYIVGARDVLSITSYDDAHLTGKFTVAADGTITYPLLGSVKVVGLSIAEVEAQLKKRLKDGEFFYSARIAVAVLAFTAQKVYISGEVRTPGAYAIGGETTLEEALKRAGGMLPSASGEAVVTHRNYNAPLVDPIKVNLRDMENGVESENIVLRDGDVVFVTRAGTYYAFGYVNRPNAYPLLSPQTTVQQALSLAGGVSASGSERRIEITRHQEGKTIILKAKLTDLIQAGDTITVKQRLPPVTVNGAVKAPDSSVPLREGWTVADVVYAAGGVAEQGGEPAPPEFTIQRIDPATGKLMMVKNVQGTTVLMPGDIVTVRIPRT